MGPNKTNSIDGWLCAVPLTVQQTITSQQLIRIINSFLKRFRVDFSADAVYTVHCTVYSVQCTPGMSEMSNFAQGFVALLLIAVFSY